MSATATLTWFARHEFRLSWRDWIAMMSGGRKLRQRTVLIGLGLFALALHGLVYAAIAPAFADGVGVDTGLLVAITGSLLLALSMMLSQSMESVTRAFYARDDLDLILSSPASSERLFAVRVVAIAASTFAMVGVLGAPLINSMVMLDGWHWLAAYPVLAGVGAIATGLSVLLTIALFSWVGAKRTRLIAQIAAAVIGAAFLIGIQVVAVIHYGRVSRFEVFGADAVLQAAPASDSILWLPAFAALGAPMALLIFLGLAIAFLAAVIALTASRFGELVLAAAGVAQAQVSSRGRGAAFQNRSTAQALRH